MGLPNEGRGWDTTPREAIAHALTLLERQTIAMERIADRFDSLTYDPTDADEGPFGPDPSDSAGPELRVRRW